MSERTLDQAEKVISQLERKNMELQVIAIQAELAQFDAMATLINAKGPMLGAQLQVLQERLKELAK